MAVNAKEGALEQIYAWGNLGMLEGYTGGYLHAKNEPARLTQKGKIARFQIMNRGNLSL